MGSGFGEKMIFELREKKEETRKRTEEREKEQSSQDGKEAGLSWARWKVDSEAQGVWGPKHTGPESQEEQSGLYSI